MAYAKQYRNSMASTLEDDDDACILKGNVRAKDKKRRSRKVNPNEDESCVLGEDIDAGDTGGTNKECTQSKNADTRKNIEKETEEEKSNSDFDDFVSAYAPVDDESCILNGGKVDLSPNKTKRSNRTPVPQHQFPIDEKCIVEENMLCQSYSSLSNNVKPNEDATIMTSVSDDVRGKTEESAKSPKVFIDFTENPSTECTDKFKELIDTFVTPPSIETEDANETDEFTDFTGAFDSPSPNDVSDFTDFQSAEELPTGSYSSRNTVSLL